MMFAAVLVTIVIVGLTVIFFWTKSGKKSNVKAAICSYIAYEASGYLDVNPTEIQESLFVKDTIVLKDAKVKPYVTDMGNGRSMTLTGCIQDIHFTWKWTLPGAPSSLIHKEVSAGIVKDPLVAIKCMKLKATFSEKESNVESVAVEEESALYEFAWNQVQKVIDVLTIDVADFELVVELPPTEETEKQKQSVSILIKSKSIQLESFGRKHAKNLNDATLEQRLILDSLFSNIVASDTATSRSVTYPLMDPFSYTTAVSRVDGTRFDGLFAGLNVDGHDGANESTANQVMTAGASNGIVIHADVVQTHTLVRLQGLFTSSDDTSGETDTCSTTPTTTTTIITNNDAQQDVGDGTTDTPSLFKLPISSVTILNMDTSTLTFGNLDITYKADDTVLNLALERCERDAHDNQSVSTVVSGISLHMYPTMKLVIDSIDSLNLPGVFQSTKKVSDSTAAFEGDTLCVKFTSIEGTTHQGDSDETEQKDKAKKSAHHRKLFHRKGQSTKNDENVTTKDSTSGKQDNDNDAPKATMIEETTNQSHSGETEQEDKKKSHHSSDTKSAHHRMHFHLKGKSTKNDENAPTKESTSGEHDDDDDAPKATTIEGATHQSDREEAEKKDKEKSHSSDTKSTHHQKHFLRKGLLTRKSKNNTNDENVPEDTSEKRDDDEDAPKATTTEGATHQSDDSEETKKRDKEKSHSSDDTKSSHHRMHFHRKGKPTKNDENAPKDSTSGKHDDDDDDDAAPSNITFPIKASFQDISLKSASDGSVMSFQDLHFDQQPDASHSGAAVQFRLGHLNSDLLKLQNSSISAFYVHGDISTIRNFKFDAKDIQISSGYSFEQWYETLQTMLDLHYFLMLIKPPDEWQLAVKKDALKMPFAQIAPLSIRVSIKGTGVNVEETTVNTDSFQGNAKTTSKNVILFLTEAIARSVPAFITNANVLNMNVLRQGGAMASADAWADAVATADMDAGGMGAGMGVGIGIFAAIDAGEAAISLGKEKRGATPDQRYKLGDLTRGLRDAPSELGRIGARRRGTNEDGDESGKDKVVDVAVGAVYSAEQYVVHNRKELAVAGVGGIGVIAGTAMGGPVGGIVIGLSASIGTAATFDILEYVRKKAEKKMNKDLATTSQGTTSSSND